MKKKTFVYYIVYNLHNHLLNLMNHNTNVSIKVLLAVTEQSLYLLRSIAIKI